MPVADDEYVMVAAGAPAGCTTDDVSWPVLPSARLSEVGCTVNDVIAFGAAVTFTVTPAVNAVVVKPVPEPLAVTVIVAVPGATAVTTPAVVTVAIDALLVAYA